MPSYAAHCGPSNKKKKKDHDKVNEHWQRHSSTQKKKESYSCKYFNSLNSFKKKRKKKEK